MARAFLVFVFLGLLGLLGWANWPGQPLPADAWADLVIVKKSDRILQLVRDGATLKSYSVSLGRSPIGPKRREGDGKTPEGTYLLDYRKTDSSFHRALHVSYPSSEDAALAQVAGASPGGLIMIHGIRNGLGFVGRLHRAIDWTDGCVAVTNSEIEEIWNAVPDGTPIRIEP